MLSYSFFFQNALNFSKYFLKLSNIKYYQYRSVRDDSSIKPIWIIFEFHLLYSISEPLIEAINRSPPLVWFN